MSIQVFGAGPYSFKVSVHSWSSLKSLECQAYRCIKGILICIPVQKLSILFSLYYQKKENIVNVIQQTALKQNFQIKKYKEVLVILFIAEMKNKLYIVS